MSISFYTTSILPPQYWLPLPAVAVIMTAFCQDFAKYFNETKLLIAGCCWYYFPEPSFGVQLQFCVLVLLVQELWHFKSLFRRVLILLKVRGTGHKIIKQVIKSVDEYIMLLLYALISGLVSVVRDQWKGKM